MSPCTAYLLTSFVDHFVPGHPQKINIWFRLQLTSAQYVVYRAGRLLLPFPVLCQWPLRKLLQNSCRDTSQGQGYLSLDTVRSMRDHAAQLGAELNEALAGDFELEPSRKYPQPVVAIRTLKQRHIEASRKPGRTSTLTQFMHHLVSATAPNQRRVF
ncbi:hypothetical protein SESI111939_21295 [Serratia silvae]